MAVAWRNGNVPLVSISPPPASWEEAILIGARPLMNAEICFYETEDDRDDITGTGSVLSTIIWQGKARVQHLRAPRESGTEYQANDVRSFRFQLDPEDDPPFVYSGAKARVLNGGRDKILETLGFVVDSGVNSSHMAVRTIELKANMRPVEWGWGPGHPIFPANLLYPSDFLYPNG